VLENIKSISPVVEYSKVGDDEFVKVPELGCYVQSKGGAGISSAYRIYYEHSHPYFPASEDMKGDYSKLKKIDDAERLFGKSIKDIPSIKIPGGDRTLPGKKFIDKNLNILAHYNQDETISYIHVRSLKI